MEAKYGVLKAVEISSREQVRGKRPVRLKVFVRGVAWAHAGMAPSTLHPHKNSHTHAYTRLF